MTIPSLRAIRILLVIALLFGYSAHAEELFSHANSLYPTFYGERSIDIDIDGDGFRDIFSSSSQWGQGMAAFTLTLHKNLPVDCFATTIAAHLETLSEFLDLTVRAVHFRPKNSLKAPICTTLVALRTNFYATLGFKNHAGAYFSEATAEMLDSYSRSNTCDAVAVGDIDGDGLEDLVCSGPTVSGARMMVFLNRQGRLQASSILNPPVSYDGSLVLEDMDGDGDNDLVVSGQTVRIFDNDGSGVLSGPRSVSPVAHAYAQIAVGDMNQDGLPDIVAAGPSTIEVLYNQGTGSFVPSNSPILTSGRTSDIQLADLDQDGDADIFAGVLGLSPQLLLIENAGQDSWIDRSALVPTLPRSAAYTSLSVQDFNQDGLTDLVAASGSTPPVYFEQRPNGTFQDLSSVMIPSISNVFKHALGFDYDNNGLPDLVFNGEDQGNRVLTNIGTRLIDIGADRSFPEVDGLGAPTRVCAGDFTGTGISEFLVLYSNGTNFIYPSNGTGNLGNQVALPPSIGASRSVTIQRLFNCFQ